MLDISKIKGKNVLVVGMGRSGRAAVKALIDMGALVSVQDNKAGAIDEEFNKYLDERGVIKYLGCTPEETKRFDLLVLSPGVPPDLGFIESARQSGAEVIGELELAYRLCRGSFVAITGTNGKTTTTTLVGEIYKASGRDTCVGGNIGNAITLDAVKADEKTCMITEVSSFQLETICDFRPAISAILNLTPDHMDRHKTMENYGRAKAAVFKNQTENEYCILNFDDKRCFELGKSEKCRAKIVPFSRCSQPELGAFVKNGYITIRDIDGNEVRICRVDELRIPGTHNLENALAAAAVCYFGGIEPEIIGSTIKKFAGVEHRIELCREIGGVRFVNDSKGTNTDAAIKAIEAMGSNIILIAGGYDKGGTFDEFIAAFKDRVKALVLMGVTAPKIRAAAEKAGFLSVTVAENMDNCVIRAWEMAEPGDVVLLSPACASWDMYDNFEQRGEHFKECVQKL